MSTVLRWTVRALALVAALVLAVPALHRLQRADEPMPLPTSTWRLPAQQVEPRPASSPTSTTPWTVFVPELDVELAFHDAQAVDGWLQLDDSLTTGVHYANGATLERGSFLVAAHVNSRDLSLSPFAKLWRVQPGTRVWVSDGAGVAHEFVVTGLNSYPKQAIPRDYFRAAGASRLVLVTCGGELIMRPDGSRQYADNVVVEALPAKAG